MRTSIRVALSAAVLFAMMGTHPLAGQQVPSAYSFVETRQELGVFGGWANLGSGRFGFGPGSALKGGGRYSIQLSGPLGFEGAASVLSATRDVIDPGRAEGDRVVGEADALLGSVEARLSLTLTGDRSWHGLAPYILLGGGMIFDLDDAQEPADAVLLAEDRFDFGSSFLGTAGFGSRLFLSDRLALRGDALFSIYQIDTPPGFSDPVRGFPAVEESEWVSALSLSLSLGYRF